jgi:hypothetical protein
MNWCNKKTLKGFFISAAYLWQTLKDYQRLIEAAKSYDF